MAIITSQSHVQSYLPASSSAHLSTIGGRRKRGFPIFFKIALGKG